jgi:hypothetical protein
VPTISFHDVKIFVLPAFVEHFTSQVLWAASQYAREISQGSAEKGRSCKEVRHIAV